MFIEILTSFFIYLGKINIVIGCERLDQVLSYFLYLHVK